MSDTYISREAAKNALCQLCRDISNWRMCERQGYRAEIACGWQEAAQILEIYLQGEAR